MSPLLILILLITFLYYKFFLFGLIPFPGDLLVGSYSPWFDYIKIPVHNPSISDVFSQFFLWKYLSIDSYKMWQWPLWNIYSFSGTPLLATFHSAVLYPLNILLFLPKHFGWGIYIFSQTLIASLTFYLFISSLVKSKIARITGALIFSLSGLMTTWLEFGTAVHAMSWLPLSFFSVISFLKYSKVRYLILLTLSLSLIILAGNPQIATYSFMVLGLFLIWLFFSERLPVFKIALLITTMVFPLLITSIQLLSSFDLLQKSIRQNEIYSEDFNFGLLKPKDVIRFFIPDYFGNTVTRNYWGTLNYHETSSFVGIISLPLLLYAFFKIRNNYVNFFTLILILSLLLLFDNPFSHFIFQTKIPLLTSSYASRILFLTTLCIAVISSFSLNHIRYSKSVKFLFKSALWSWATLAGIFIGTGACYFIIKKIQKGASSSDYDYALSNFIVAAKNTIIPFTIITLFLIIGFIIFKIKIKFIKDKISLLLFLIFVFYFLDLGRYFLKFNPFVSKDFIFPTTPAIEYLQKQPGLFRVGREHSEVLPPNTWIGYNLQSYEGYDPLYLKRYGKLICFLNNADIRNCNTSRYAEIYQNYSSSFIDVMNSKYFITILRDANGQIPGNIIDYRVKVSGFTLVFQDKSVAILKNPNALERTFFASNISTQTNDLEIENALMNKDFDPRKNIILSKDLKIASVSGIGKSEIVKYSPNKVIIKTKTETDEILILSDTFDEGWKAKIDGKLTKVSSANLVFRAIKVPAGEHEVLYYYWPDSFQKGLIISISSLLTLGLIILISIRTRIF